MATSLHLYDTAKCIMKFLSVMHCVATYHRCSMETQSSQHCRDGYCVNTYVDVCVRWHICIACRTHEPQALIETCVLQVLLSMASMLTDLMNSKDAELGQLQHLISGLQKQLHAFCANMLHHMQV